LLRRRELTSDDVREVVYESIMLIAEVQHELDLPVCPNIDKTWRVLRRGTFCAARLPRERAGAYLMAFGAFEPPSTIVMDSRIPFCDRPLNIPEVPHTLLRYTATHEVVHADDHLGGDVLYHGTREHILEDHDDKLEKGMAFIESEECRDQIQDREDLASLWAMQYVDMVTHYRSYIVLRKKGFPRLDLVWGCMQDSLFPPSLLTKIERERDLRYVFESILCQVGEYCLIDALMESSSIGEKAACSYTV